MRGMLDRQIDGLVYGCLATRRVELSAAVTELPVVLLNCLADPLPGTRRDPGRGRRRARGRPRAARGRAPRRDLRDRTAPPRRARGPIGGCAGSAPSSPRRVRPRGPRRLRVDARGRPRGRDRACSRAPGRAALICLNDRIALGAYQAIQQAGLRIPRDVSVVAFDDSVMAGWLQPGLSSVALPHYEMGRLATDLLIKDERHRTVHLVDMLAAPPRLDRAAWRAEGAARIDPPFTLVRPPTSHDRPLRIPQRRGPVPGRRQHRRQRRPRHARSPPTRASPTCWCSPTAGTTTSRARGTCSRSSPGRCAGVVDGGHGLPSGRTLGILGVIWPSRQFALPEQMQGVAAAVGPPVTQQDLLDAHRRAARRLPRRGRAPGPGGRARPPPHREGVGAPGVRRPGARARHARRRRRRRGPRRAVHAPRRRRARPAGRARADRARPSDAGPRRTASAGSSAAG